MTDSEGKTEILVFYQMVGDDLVGFSRDVDSNNWAIININVQGLTQGFGGIQKSFGDLLAIAWKGIGWSFLFFFDFGQLCLLICPGVDC